MPEDRDSSTSVSEPVEPVPAPASADREELEDSDAAPSSPGAWTPLAAPGKPDGEVDTRA